MPTLLKTNHLTATLHHLTHYSTIHRTFLRRERPQLSLRGSSSCGYGEAAMCGLVAWPPSLAPLPTPTLVLTLPQPQALSFPPMSQTLSQPYVPHNQQTHHSTSMHTHHILSPLHAAYKPIQKSPARYSFYTNTKRGDK